MKHAASQSLYTYWNWLRAGRAAPERGDIDPASIRGVLADTFIVEIEDLGPARPPGLVCRLSGTRVNALFDSELKGRSLSSWWQGADVVPFQGIVASVLDGCCPAVVGAQGSPAGFAPLSLELLLLPLRHHGKTHARLLGALSPAAVPAWLGLVPTGPLTLISHRMVEEPFGATPRIAPLTARMATPGRRLSSTRRGHFMIYDGGLSVGKDENDAAVR